MVSQRIEVRVIADPWQYRNDDSQCCLTPFQCAVARRSTLAADCILSIQTQPVQIREHPEYRLTRISFQPPQPRLQQADIPTKPVDHKSGHTRLLTGTQKRQSSDEVREYAT